jgi:hypothetical protein
VPLSHIKSNEIFTIYEERRKAEDFRSGIDCLFEQSGPIFIASLGPGLLFGGGWLVPA